ncbi:hypothetical protein [Fibrella arboris]
MKRLFSGCYPYLAATDMKYPRRLSSGANNTVIVLSDTEVAN